MVATTVEMNPSCSFPRVKKVVFNLEKDWRARAEKEESKNEYARRGQGMRDQYVWVLKRVPSGDNSLVVENACWPRGFKTAAVGREGCCGMYIDTPSTDEEAWVNQSQVSTRRQRTIRSKSAHVSERKGPKEEICMIARSLTV